MTACSQCNEQLHTCPQCGGDVVESYSAARDGGWVRIHHTAHRVGDHAALGSVECKAGQLGWGS